MGGSVIRSIGQARAEIKIGGMSLTYNLMRYLQLTKSKATAHPLARTTGEAAERTASASKGGRLATIFRAIEHLQCLAATFVADL